MNTRRRMQGVVTGNKMAKTVTVEISRTYRHPLYHKVVHEVSHMKAHDELNCQLGDLVQIIESKPISRTKRWMTEKIINKSEGTADLPEDNVSVEEG